MTERLRLTGILVLMGAGWGLSIPLSKIAVSTGHQPFGLIFWQLFIVVLILALVTRLRGRPLRFGRRYLGLFLMVALCGAVLPDIFFYLSVARVPAGIMAIIISSVPMFSLPIALALGNEQFAALRVLGLFFGMGGIVLLVGPETTLPDPAMAVFVLIALLAPILYATEGNLVALWGTKDLDSIQTILGASLIGMILCLPVAAATGQFINPLDAFGWVEIAFVTGAAIHGIVYATYVWLVGRAGPVFAVQVSYLVTGFGVLWSLVLLGERYSAYVWLALALMLAGMFLVQPRPRIALAPGGGIGESDPKQQGTEPR